MQADSAGIFNRAFGPNLLLMRKLQRIAGMPELIILIAALICVGSVCVLYFNRSNPAVTGIAVISFVVFLYGIGQYVERSKFEVRSGITVDTADNRAAKESLKSEATKPDAIAAVRPPRDIGDDPAKRLALPAPTQLDAHGAAAASVTISNVMSQRTASNYVEVSGTLVNGNEFAVKNIVLKCGDRSYASGDVFAVLDKVVSARSVMNISSIRMGPIRPTLPPTTCLVEKFDRAD